MLIQGADIQLQSRHRAADSHTGLHGADSLKAESDGKQVDKTIQAGDNRTWKTKQGRGWKLRGWGGGPVLEMMCLGEVLFELRPEEGGSQAEVWGKSIPGRGNSKRKAERETGSQNSCVQSWTQLRLAE